MIDNATKRERLQKWCAALRSGKFEQSSGQFHRFSGHCCLGVAELIENLPRLNNAPLKVCGGDSYRGLEDFYKISQLESAKLASMNDSGEYSFPKIADYIEQNLMPAGE